VHRPATYYEHYRDLFDKATRCTIAAVSPWFILRLCLKLVDAAEPALIAKEL
jgi:hypothetical protein